MLDRIFGMRRVLGLGAGLFALAVAACDAPSPTSGAMDTVEAPVASSVTGLPVYEVEVNVKHGNDGGPINLKGNRNSSGGGNGQAGASLTVSALGTGEFDLALVDWSSLRIGDATTVPATPVTQLNRKYQGSIVDLNGDGILDLMMHFSISEMVANGNLSESTTAFCLTGQGEGYLIHGCGGDSDDDGSGGDGGDGGDTGNGGGPGSTAQVEILPFGDAGQEKMAWVTPIPYWLNDAEDSEVGYPGWMTLPLSAFETATSPDRLSVWEMAPMLVGSEAPPTIPGAYPDGFLEAECGLPESVYYWGVNTQLLMRSDVQLPAGATGVVIEYVVDNDAAVYLNGQLLTRGFQTAQTNGCASYSKTTTVRVPDDVLSADGNNLLAVQARDFGYVNFFDIRITAEVPAG